MENAAGGRASSHRFPKQAPLGCNMQNSHTLLPHHFATQAATAWSEAPWKCLWKQEPGFT